MSLIVNLKTLFQTSKGIFFPEEADAMRFGAVGVGRKVNQICSRALF